MTPQPLPPSSLLMQCGIRIGQKVSVVLLISFCVLASLEKSETRRAACSNFLVIEVYFRWQVNLRRPRTCRRYLFLFFTSSIRWNVGVWAAGCRFPNSWSLLVTDKGCSKVCDCSRWAAGQEIKDGRMHQSRESETLVTRKWNSADQDASKALVLFCLVLNTLPCLLYRNLTVGFLLRLTWSHW